VKVYDRSWQPKGFARIEQALYRAAGVDPDEDQHWTSYAAAVLGFSIVSLLLTYLVLRLQAMLPLNADDMAAVVPRQAFETAVSFTTNTNWQSYGGETMMSHFTQAFQLTFQNFASAAVGLGVAFAFFRGLSRRSAGRIGNFWADLVRGTLYLLLPLSLIVALVMMQQGVIQNWQPTLEVTTLEGASQRIALGPVASQESIKQIGTNGGGFFNANAAHPFENPTPLSNFLSMLAIFAIPAASVYAFGVMTKNLRHAWTLWAAMGTLFVGGVAVTYWAESQPNPLHEVTAVAGMSAVPLPGGNMEGKEQRFGIAESSLYAVTTTAASCGAVNAMHDSFTPIGGLMTMLNMQLGELIFGGVGAGMYGMLMMVVLTVFIAGLMIGRSPEYLGKRIGRREIQMVVLYTLASPLMILGLTALASVSDAGVAGLNNAGAHGLSEILYAFSSTTANNGSAFAGLTGGTTFYNTWFGIAMLVGRFALIVPVLALAGFLAERRVAPTTAGTLPLHGSLFLTLLIGVILIVGALTFFPALSLGPIAEQLQLLAGRVV
jgi:K+-transporting ATPase ATPase A chain